MKSIDLNEVPYLQRYYMGGIFGYQIWLHRFMTADSERHLHSHPWTAVSVVLSGWYIEEIHGAPSANLRLRLRLPAVIGPSRIHRIGWTQAGTWTLMLVGRKRESEWFFIDDSGKKVSMKTSERDWWKNYGPRRES